MQELQRDRGLAGAGVAFEQVQAVAGKAATEHEIEPFDSGARVGQKSRVHVHRANPRLLLYEHDVGGSDDCPGPRHLEPHVLTRKKAVRFHSGDAGSVRAAARTSKLNFLKSVNYTGALRNQTPIHTAVPTPTP